MIGKRFGDFEIKEEIGKGGMGQVYKARQISLDRDVAIKILPGNLSEVEEFRERFDVEAKAVASLMHENILQMYSKGVTDDGIHYFAMELVDGEDLADKIKRGVTFSEAEAIDIAIQVCRGLEAAWKKGIIHRDIKPSNIMLTKSGTVKIADFGLAKSLDATKKLTQTNMYMGTVAYTSPEQGEGKTLDHRTDIYSLGIVLYQLLTGSVPFKAETPSSVIFKHVYEAPPSPRTINPGVSPQAEAVVLKAIAKRPEDRFQNAVEFKDALESLKEMQSGKKGGTAKEAAVSAVAQPSLSGAEGATESKSRSNLPFLVAVVLIILLVGGSVLYASKYGYRALFSKAFPFALQEEKKVETVPQATEETAVTPSQEAGLPKTEPGRSVSPGGLPRREFATIPAPSTVGKERAITRDNVVPVINPAETGTASGDQSRRANRPSMPAVLVVASGESNISDIVESVIARKLQQRSFPISSGGDIEALLERYGRHNIPLKAFDQRQLKADVLVYVTVSTMNAGPLEFYGQRMEQYASTISLKVVDAATKKAIASPRTKTVHYTTLNMQDNIEEATEELMSDLPKRLTTFWRG